MNKLIIKLIFSIILFLPNLANANTDTASIRVLNKITAKSHLINLNFKQETEFGTISMILHKCWKSPPDQKLENKILLEVFETNTQNNIKKRIFYGWIFSSSPSISGLEHPIYDLTAISCNKNG